MAPQLFHESFPIEFNTILIPKTLFEDVMINYRLMCNPLLGETFWWIFLHMKRIVLNTVVLTKEL